MRDRPRVAPLALDAGAEPLPDPDPDRPRRELDRTHVWIAGAGSWHECCECGMRDYFAGASEPCKLRRSRGRMVPLEKAAETLGASDEFVAWAYSELGIGPRSIDEWQAHWMEWKCTSTPTRR